MSAAPLWMRAVVAPATLRFQTEHPDVALSLRTATFSEGVRLLVDGAGEMHLGGIDDGRVLPAFLRREPLLRVTAGIVARRDHPLHGARPTPGDLVHHPLARLLRLGAHPRPARAGLRSPRSSSGCASAPASTPDRCSARARRDSSSSPRGRGSPGFRSPSSRACPRSASVRCPLTFGRRRYPSGLVARRSAEDLAPVRRFEDIVRTIALERPG